MTSGETFNIGNPRSTLTINVVGVPRRAWFNVLNSAMGILTSNGETQAIPTFAGDTIYTCSEALDTAPSPDRDDSGALQTRQSPSREGDGRAPECREGRQSRLPRGRGAGPGLLAGLAPPSATGLRAGASFRQSSCIERTSRRARPA